MDCPKCRARRGDPCVGNKSQSRISFHRARGDAYLATIPTDDEARDESDVQEQ